MEAKADKPEGYEPSHTLQEVPPCCRTFARGVSRCDSTQHRTAGGRVFRLRFPSKRRSLRRAMTRSGAGIRTE